MMDMQPAALYGLEVPPGDILIPAAAYFPGTIRITMAALDPTEEPEADEEGNTPNVGRSTLKLVKERYGREDSPEDDEEEAYLRALLGKGDNSDSDEEDSDDEPNGGPSDPSKSKKAREEASVKKLLESVDTDDSDEEMEDGDKQANGIASKSKGKEPATSDDEDDEEESEDSVDGLDLETFVVCTLDTERTYQQAIDITISEGEKAFFIVSGTHTISLTGNYIDTDDSSLSGSDLDEDEDEDGLYDLPPGMEDLVDELDSDELDDAIEETGRVEEVDSDEEAPKLVAVKKGKKRPAQDEEDEVEGLDEMIAKETQAEVKLSKKQMKKLKNNKGVAVAATETTTTTVEAVSSATPKSDKKVQFAKNLELGPTGSAEKAKESDKKAPAGKQVRVVQGVTVDDRTVGKGRGAKSGDKVAMRYIGKLESNGKVFDSNKKGNPFSFKLGAGEVIKGWDIGVAGMAVGGERRLTIPGNLAYGSKGTQGIPPNSTLVFDVKLLSIK